MYFLHAIKYTILLQLGILNAKICFCFMTASKKANYITLPHPINKY